MRRPPGARVPPTRLQAARPAPAPHPARRARRRAARPRRVVAFHGDRRAAAAATTACGCSTIACARRLGDLQRRERLRPAAPAARIEHRQQVDRTAPPAARLRRREQFQQPRARQRHLPAREVLRPEPEAVSQQHAQPAVQLGAAQHHHRLLDRLHRLRQAHRRLLTKAQQIGNDKAMSAAQARRRSARCRGRPPRR